MVGPNTYQMLTAAASDALLYSTALSKQLKVLIRLSSSLAAASLPRDQQHAAQHSGVGCQLLILRQLESSHSSHGNWFTAKHVLFQAQHTSKVC